MNLTSIDKQIESTVIMPFPNFSQFPLFIFSNSILWRTKRSTNKILFCIIDLFLFIIVSIRSSRIIQTVVNRATIVLRLEAKFCLPCNRKSILGYRNTDEFVKLATESIPSSLLFFSEALFYHQADK